MVMTFGAIGRAMPVGRLRTSSLILVLATGLAGCVAQAPSPPGSDRFLVEPVRLTHQVTFADGTSALGDGAYSQLITFLDEADPEGRGDVYLDAAGPDRNGRLDTVAAALDDLGRVALGTGGIEAAEHGVTVTLLQDVILPEACLSADGWPEPDLPPASCAQALTLIDMVEDQDDLLYGREMGPALSATAARAATRYLERRAPHAVEERPASVEPQSAPELPPAPLTQEAGY